MKSLIYYITFFGAIFLILPNMDLFSYSILVFIVLHIIFQIGAIISIVNEDILYSQKEKILRSFMVLFIPIFGILIEYMTARKHDKKNYDTSGGEDTITGGSGMFTGISPGLMSFGSGGSHGGNGGGGD